MAWLAGMSLLKLALIGVYSIHIFNRARPTIPAPCCCDRKCFAGLYFYNLCSKSSTAEEMSSAKVECVNRKPSRPWASSWYNSGLMLRA